MENIDNLLAHSFTPHDIGDEMTVRQYLAKLLLAVLEEGECFSGKRPFGNSGWEENLVIPAIECGALRGEIDLSDPGWPEATGWDEGEYGLLLVALVDRGLGAAPVGQ